MKTQKNALKFTFVQDRVSQAKLKEECKNRWIEGSLRVIFERGKSTFRA